MKTIIKCIAVTGAVCLLLLVLYALINKILPPVHRITPVQKVDKETRDTTDNIDTTSKKLIAMITPFDNIDSVDKEVDLSDIKDSTMSELVENSMVQTTSAQATVKEYKVYLDKTKDIDIDSFSVEKQVSIVSENNELNSDLVVLADATTDYINCVEAIKTLYKQEFTVQEDARKQAIEKCQNVILLNTKVQNSIIKIGVSIDAK